MSASIVISQQLLERSQASERAWNELWWIATHYESATPEQRARLDAWEKNFDKRAAEGYFDD